MGIQRNKDLMIQKFKHSKSQRLMRFFWRRGAIRMTIQCMLLVAAVFSFVSASDANANKYNWGPLLSGTNGTVNAITYWNGKIVVGGGFTQAGGISANNIAWYTGSAWEQVGGGLNDTVYALIVFGPDLYAAGRFTLSGTRGIARWSGSTWLPFGLGFNDDVRALMVYNSRIYAGGVFTSSGSDPLNHISFWNPSQGRWDSLASGVNNIVFALGVYNPGTIDHLYVGGDFTNAGGQSANHVASWNVSQWLSLGSGVNDRVYAMTVFRDTLIIGGSFTTAGGSSASRIASWNGTSWSSIGGGMTDAVFSLTTYNNELVSGGVFRYAGTHYVDRIAKWNGADWSRMITGTNSMVNALFVHDTSLYAGGSFTTAGGKYISHIAEWSNQPTVTVSGIIRYLDNGQPVPPGSKVRALRLDVNTREIIAVDSAFTDSTGHYQLNGVLRDSNTYILSFPNDPLLNVLAQDFVPTYYPSSINWVDALRIYPNVPLTNINVNVLRITPEPQNPLLADLGGHVYLRFTPPLPGDAPTSRDFENSTSDIGLPYKSGAIVYAKQGAYYRKFAVSNTLEEYTLTQLPAGTYDLYVNRIGYTSAMKTRPLGNVSIDTVDFYLDTLNPIGIHNINTEVPERFVLEQNYPNPFNPSTKIRFSLPHPSEGGESIVRLLVYDIIGREVAALVNEQLQPGTYEVTWNAGELASGLYFYQLQAGDYAETKKMVLIK